jgi:hypothetical protein
MAQNRDSRSSASSGTATGPYTTCRSIDRDDAPLETLLPLVRLLARQAAAELVKGVAADTGDAA